jgi:hypothetical protein
MVMVRIIQSEYNVYLDIKELNKLVVKFCVDNIIQNIGFYMQYLRDLNEGPNKSSYEQLRSGGGQGYVDVSARPVNTRESKESVFKNII